MSQLVAKNHIVTLDYHVTNPDGEVVDEGREALVYLHGGYDDIFPKIPHPRISDAARTNMDARRFESAIGSCLKVPTTA